jgi:hypothetical protein
MRLLFWATLLQSQQQFGFPFQRLDEGFVLRSTIEADKSAAIFRPS